MTMDVIMISCMVLLPKKQQDLNKFFWRDDPVKPLREYRITRIRFLVLASSFAASMAVKHNAVELENEYLQAAKVVFELF